MPSYIIYDKEAEKLEREVTPQMKRAWERVAPAVQNALKSMYKDLDEAAADVVKLVFYKNKGALNDLEKYLADNVGGAPDAIKQVAKRVRAMIASAHPGLSMEAATQPIRPSLEPLEELTGIAPAPHTVARKEEETLFAARLVKELGITFSDPVLERRFKEVLLSRVSDLRSPTATQEFLEKAPDKGGVGLAHQKVLEVIAKIEKVLEARSDGARRAALKQTAAAGLAVKTELAAPVVLPPHALQTMISIGATAGTPTTTPPATPPPSSTPPPPPSVSPPRPGYTRPVVQDIVPPDALVGPKEEIGQMRLVDFRRLSAKPELAAEKIKERLKLMREDSFTQYAGGVRAWRASPLHKSYVEMLNKALEKGTITYDPLTHEELTAIIKLNQQLVY